MQNLSEITFKIINQILHIRKGEVISVSGEIHNIEGNDPLSEISLLEELAVAIRKKGAFPHLEISTAKLKHRFFAEISEELINLKPSYYLKWINDLNTFIEIGWKNIYQVHNSKSNEMLKKIEKSISEITEKILKDKKTLLFLNFPSPELASMLEQDYENLLLRYFRMLNIDYDLLQLRGLEIQNKYKARNIVAFDQNYSLKFKTDPENPIPYCANTDKSPIIILPTGKVEFLIDRLSLSGEFVAERIYYKDNIFDNVQFAFERGEINNIRFNYEKKGNFILENALINSKNLCFFSLGLNPGNRSLTNYYSYDRCIDNAVSFKFFDNESEPILLLNRQIKLKSYR